MFDLGGVGVFLVIFLIVVMIFVIKCCIDSDRRPKVTRRPHAGSYQNVPYTITHATAATPSAPRETSTINDTEIDGIVLIPDNTSASPVVVPPYPVEPRHPTPQAIPPGPGFATSNPPYPTHTPHPVPATGPYTAGPAPYPPVGVTPYPPTGPPVGSAPYPDYSAQPPSYSEAVSQPPIPTKEGYSKQAPYNPNY